MPDIIGKCCICDSPVEPWPNGNGFGHNPAPLCMGGGRACNWCNENVVIPVRIHIAGVRI